MRPLTLQEIERIIRGKVTADAGALVSGICTDTRKVHPGDLFVALKGERTDGHNFVDTAFDGGAAAALVSEEWYYAEKRRNAPFVLTPDPLQALAALGEWSRRMCEIPVIAITGSTGKTTTREMLGAILRQCCLPLVSPANFNTEIGVPITLLDLAPEHDVAVIEMAMRGRGQIASLCQIAKPTAGLITNIGLAHLELLGSQDNIAAAKAEVLESLPGEGWAVLPFDDHYFDFLKSKAPGPVISFGMNEGADYRAIDVKLNEKGCATFTMQARGGSVQVTLQVPGPFHVYNALAATAAACRFSIDLEHAAVVLGRYAGFDKRSLVRSNRKGWTVIDETYNASPAAVTGALQGFKAMKTEGRKAVVLGDMRELGEQAEQAHRDVGKEAAAAGPELIITVGELSRLITSAAQEAGFAGENKHFDDSELVADYIREWVKPGDLILVKGSRVLEMERVVDNLL